MQQKMPNKIFRIYNRGASEASSSSFMLDLRASLARSCRTSMSTDETIGGGVKNGKI